MLRRNDRIEPKASRRLRARSAHCGRPTLLLDGQVIALDGDNISRFQLLQRGIGGAHYAVFDCLCVRVRDLRLEPLSTRRAELERAVCAGDELILCGRLSANGLEAFRVAKRRRYEGLVAKRLAAVYVERRSREWLKVKVHQCATYVASWARRMSHVKRRGTLARYARTCASRANPKF